MRDGCLLVSVKKSKKDTQTKEHRCHSESVITRAVSVKKTKEDTRMEEHKHICHSEGAITGAGGVKLTKASDQPPAKRKSKIMNIKERKSLLKFLDSGDDTVLSAVVKDDLK